MATSMDTFLYDLSIPFISSLQSQLSEHADFMQLMSTVLDPKYAFLIYSPIAYLLDQRVGKRLILTTVIAEWLNQILKWLLHGERPYWYVHSSGHFDPQQTPIKQFPITCELGPGHPSGHAMVTAAVWYIILDSALIAYSNHIAHLQPSSQTESPQLAQQVEATSNQEQPSKSDEKSTRRHMLGAKLSIWTLYLIILLTVSISRIFLGCHFPHQCLVGASLGILLARYISTLETRASHFIYTSGFVFCTAFGTFLLLQALNFDPNWTIKLASKHCIKREYIHLDTAPFFSIMRYCGFALGCGLGLLMPATAKSRSQTNAIPAKLISSESTESQDTTQMSMVADEPVKQHQGANYSWLSAKILTAMMMARLVDNLGLFVSHSNLYLFYSCALVAYTLFSFALINLDKRPPMVVEQSSKLLD